MIKNNQLSRKIILDIETTGMNFSGLFFKNHKIIEIGALELFERNITGKKFHVYLNPDRIIDSSAFKIHGISEKFLINKPRFCDIFIDFLNFIKNSEIIIHNAKFDIGFLNYEFKKLNLNFPNLFKIFKITDTLKIARNMFPGKKNSIDALCSRFKISTVKRLLHSAIIDTKLLAKIYLNMTSLQKKISFNNFFFDKKKEKKKKNKKKINIFLQKANLQEKKIHEKYLKFILKKTGFCMWN